ncbi:MAG: phosphoribosyl-AMP cyclohydrolase [Deltaproteobacteria bacterium]|nr:phosphoribosyl-AMP cyclohydrolase [Deltaproteobacteria bacterium]
MVELDFEKTGGLIPAIAQDAADGRVLMMAYMNQLAWEKTLSTGQAHYWSRSRRELWHKGGTSGHVQQVVAVFVDCDNDTILLQVNQLGGAAGHTGYRSCFYRRVDNQGGVTVVDEKVFDPNKVYPK